MNIPNEMARYLNNFLNDGCIINNTPCDLKEIERMGWINFTTQARLYTPPKLYKYFPNVEKKDKGKLVNYSIQALENNTVFMQSPSNFDDIYDSDISIDFRVYEKIRLIEYCRRCGISINKDLATNEIGNKFLNAIMQSLYKHKNYENIFTVKPELEMENLENEIFCKTLTSEMKNTDDLGKGVSSVLGKEYIDFVNNLKNIFRVSCFATTPYSQLMWGGMYADCHKGFCIEYTVSDDKEYTTVLFNLFPMIYCKARPDISEFFATMKTKEFSEENLWNIYFHGALRKSIDWAFQNEWRLLLPLGIKSEVDYNIPFFPITKVFLGNRMPNDKRKQIIDICNKKGISYTGVKKNPLLFEMQECEIKCENCPAYIQDLHNAS